MTQNEFFNRYQYDLDKDQLGEGGFGKVFKALDDIRDRHVAIKVAEVRKGQEALSLQKEVELANQLPKQHRNIAHYEACYRFKTPHGTFDYGILQYYPAGNLSQLIQDKKLTQTQKEAIAKGIIAGLAYLHQQEVVHRDLKSSNILIAERADGEYIPKIADFGLSKLVNNTNNSYFSNSFGGGSLLYAAPEQLAAGNIRKNVDLWSLGVVLYELFLEKLPFYPNASINSETGRVELVKKISDGILPNDLQQIPQNWQSLIASCLIPDASKRIKNTTQVQQILDGNLNWEFASEISEFTTPDTEIDEPIQNNASSPKSNKTVWILTSFILLCLLIFFNRDKFTIQEPDNKPNQSIRNTETKTQETKPTPPPAKPIAKPKEKKKPSRIGSTEYICNCGSPCKVKILALGTNQTKVKYLEPCRTSNLLRKLIQKELNEIEKKRRSPSGGIKPLRSNVLHFKRRLENYECSVPENTITWTSAKMDKNIPNCSSMASNIIEDIRRGE